MAGLLSLLAQTFSFSQAGYLFRDFNDRINVTMPTFASISMALTLLPYYMYVKDTPGILDFKGFCQD